MTVTGHTENRKRKISQPMTQAQAARHLGVTREHLNRVLNGRRQSRSLLKNYRTLLKAHA